MVTSWCRSIFPVTLSRNISTRSFFFGLSPNWISHYRLQQKCRSLSECSTSTGRNFWTILHWQFYRQSEKIWFSEYIGFTLVCYENWNYPLRAYIFLLCTSSMQLMAMRGFPLQLSAVWFSAVCDYWPLNCWIKYKYLNYVPNVFYLW